MRAFSNDLRQRIVAAVERREHTLSPPAALFLLAAMNSFLACSWVFPPGSLSFCGLTEGAKAQKCPKPATVISKSDFSASTPFALTRNVSIDLANPQTSTSLLVACLKGSFSWSEIVTFVLRGAIAV
jgi:hypothetical protein